MSTATTRGAPDRAVIRPYNEKEGLRTDRSAGDRKKHREKIVRSIRENIGDIISEESIIGRDRDRIIKVPIKGVKEYRFIYGDNAGGTGTGDGSTEPGQVVGSTKGKGDKGQGPAGSDPGVDYYETEITLDELIDIVFADLELPDMERKILKQVVAVVNRKKLGHVHAGSRQHLDERRTLINKVRRKIASGKGGLKTNITESEYTELSDEEKSMYDGPDQFNREFPYHLKFGFRKEDQVFDKHIPEPNPDSNAVVICMMDTSGSMDRLKKYLARMFFFLLYQFLHTEYKMVEIVFIAHHTQAKEVTEDEFFHKGESGGTLISSAYKKALEVIKERYHPDHWNIYAFHCSDGDNFESDNADAVKCMIELCNICNRVGYGEIKPMGSHYYESSMLDKFRKIEHERFQSVLIERREDVWPSFQAFLGKKPDHKRPGDYKKTK